MEVTGGFFGGFFQLPCVVAGLISRNGFYRQGSERPTL